MALTRVQATGKVIADGAASVSLTFATPPTLGNAVIVLLSLYSYGGAPPASCVDNRGNTYTLAKYQPSNTGANPSAAIYACAAVAVSAAPFTITVTGGNYWVASAIEIGGSGPGLVVDHASSATATGGTVAATGATPALTADEVLLAGVCACGGSSSTITIDVVSPPWTPEHEELSFAHAVGEADTRIVTGALGTTPQATWTLGTGVSWTAVLVAFRGPSAPAAAATTDSYVWGPL